VRTTRRSTRAGSAALLALVALGATACGNRGGGASGSNEEATEFVHIHGLAVDPSLPDVVWVATHRGLIRGVADRQWRYAGTDRSDHMGFTLDPRAGTMFRSGHPQGGGSLGVESSSDGRSWDHLDDVASPPVDFHAMTISFADDKTLYGWDSGGRGLFRSADRGTHWERLPSEGLDAPILALSAPGSAAMVLAGTASGLYRSDDGGVRWHKLADGGVSAIAGDPNDPSHLLAATEAGLRLSRDGGATWTPTNGVPPGEFIGAMTVSGRDGGVSYAAGATTIYKSTDGGATWKMVRSGT
jgi:BNR/Asp-box repeat protein